MDNYEHIFKALNHALEMKEFYISDLTKSLHHQQEINKNLESELARLDKLLTNTVNPGEDPTDGTL